jgi:predicted negative regulator of RcsB-dependent stress response
MKLLPAAAMIMFAVIGTVQAYTVDEINEQMNASFDREAGTFTEGAYEILIEAHAMIEETLQEEAEDLVALAAVETLDYLVKYNLACFEALEGNIEEAFTWLQGAVDAGFEDPAWIEQDEDLTSLRDDPRFQEILVIAGENSPVDSDGHDYDNYPTDCD